MAEMTTGITLKIAEKRYPAQGGHGAVTALTRLQAYIPPNEFCALFGPSGCGKSTLLNIIAGIDRSFSGSVRFAGGCVPRIGYVFQSPRLLPWRTVRENVALVPPRGVDPATVDGLLGEVGLTAFSGFYPARLSGGMARRAALARAFAIEPDLLLLDEPFVSLDDALAARLREELAELVNRRPVTTLLVTHNLEEAIGLADRLLLLSVSPARILADVPVARPRATHTGAELVALRDEIARRLNQA